MQLALNCQEAELETMIIIKKIIPQFLPGLYIAEQNKIYSFLVWIMSFSFIVTITNIRPESDDRG